MADRLPFSAVVFDAYGTLLDFNSAVARHGTGCLAREFSLRC